MIQTALAKLSQEHVKLEVITLIKLAGKERLCVSHFFFNLIAATLRHCRCLDDLIRDCVT